mmetsp:Transcript_13964/g.19828  ORF Transcript_13964/g.19828 Transcript_13964/m.19828 type:complete len:222 (-) Transcript_13964:119-784(-)
MMLTSQYYDHHHHHHQSLRCLLPQPLTTLPSQILRLPTIITLRHTLQLPPLHPRPRNLLTTPRTTLLPHTRTQMSLSITITILFTSHCPIGLIHGAPGISIGKDDRGNVDITTEVIAIVIETMGDGASVRANAGIAFLAGGGTIAGVGDFSPVNVREGEGLSDAGGADCALGGGDGALTYCGGRRGGGCGGVVEGFKASEFFIVAFAVATSIVSGGGGGGG